MDGPTIDGYSFPAGDGERLNAVVAALAGGDVSQALAGARLEIRLSAARGGPGATGALGDALHGARMYAFALELYRTFLLKASAQDVRRAEVMYRAGMTARRLRMYDVAVGFLSDVVRCHDRGERVESARKAVAEMEARLASTSPDSSEALLSGPCAIVRRTSGRIDISTVGRLISRASGAPLAETTRMLKSSPGFIAFDLEPTKAKELAVSVAGSGLPCLVIPQDKLVALPAPKELSRVELTPEGLTLPELASPDAPSAVLWHDVFYASVGLVRIEKQATWPAPAVDYVPSAPYGQRANSYTQSWAMDDLRRSLKSTEEKMMLDFFTLDPFQRFRVVDGSCRFSTPGQSGQPQTHSSIERFAAAFCGFGASVPANEGMTVLALDCPRMRWRELTFDGTDEFDRYNYWRLQLEQYG